MRIFAAVSAAFLIASPALAADRSGDGEPQFRALYKELVETNTELSSGSCTLAAERMAARLKAGGYGDADVRLFSTPDHPKDGGLVAQLPGSDPKAKAILLLAHIDVVEAKREDWTRDPFTLIEEGGYFYGRGTSDDKAMAAVFTDLMIRYKQEGYRPKRTIRLALTCGEETEGAFNGANWLATQHKDWIDAELALNEGASGVLDKDGKRISFNIEAAEKVYQDFTLVTTNPGGHSSQPVPDNAIYEMATALGKVSKLEFPAQLNDATRGYFTETAKLKDPETAAAMRAIVANPGDAAADAVLSKDKLWHSLLRTTCVATLIDGGHALNALPQRVTANVNCRMFPGSKVEDVRDALVKTIDDARVAVTIREPRSPATPAPQLGADLLRSIQATTAEIYPGIPVVPFMSTGATDGIYLSAVGIPTYGLTGYFIDPDNGNVHGLNERIGVQSLMDGRRFQYKLVKRLADR
ncbi:M20/M25/M40 family metallo-hydrolase [Asticcacaulis solisilvae]|uniref:M20/M25/M40 family metallo-hydrolase n=1 Tax=Asticcacaulis solisilvae TaxID=1217274 RepID=UPI003FD7976D